MQIFDKNSGPRTSCFLDWGATSAPDSGGEKGVQTMDSPMSCVSLFCLASVCESSIFVEPELCVPLFLSSRVRAYHYFCRAGFVRTTVFVEPDSCVPLFLSSRIRAYHYFCRARFLCTTIFVERELRLLGFLQCFCNPLAVWHWQPGFGSSWVGPQAEPKIEFFDVNLT